MEKNASTIYQSSARQSSQFESLIYSYNNGRHAESQRIELYNQPKLLGLNGPMYNGEKF